jgi:hypothetical protein
MEAICCSETSLETQRTTRRHIPEDETLHLKFSLKELIFYFYFSHKKFHFINNGSCPLLKQSYWHRTTFLRGHFGRLSVPRPPSVELWDGWRVMGWNVFRRNRPYHNRDTIHEFVYTDRGKPRKSSLRIADNTTGIRTKYLPNTATPTCSVSTT